MRVLLFICGLGLFGCKAMLNSLAENGEWGSMMRSAPHMPNPATHPGVTSTTEVSDQGGGSRYWLISHDSNSMCFKFIAPYSAARVQKTNFTLEAYANFMDDRPGYGGSLDLQMTNSQVTILRATETPRVVETFNTRLNVMVKELQTFYETEGKVCFPNPKIPTATSRYLLLFPTDVVGGFASYAAWQLD